MPSIFTHAVVPAAIGRSARPAWLTGSVLAVGCFLAVLPDLDVVGFRLGIAYGAPWGHRGATHSLGFAAMVVGGLALMWRAARCWPVAMFLLVSMASHGLLDMLTDGGKGVALLWPLTNDRYFALLRPIRVSPIGARFLSARGLETVVSELTLVWLPSLALLVLTKWRRKRS